MKVSELFEVRYGQSLELNRLTQVISPEGVNLVSRAMTNNGVTARVALPPDVVPAPAGEISVALGGNGVLSSFVQPEPFVCGRDVAILKPRDPSMSLEEKLWWCHCILANKYRFSYGRQANRTLPHLNLPDEIPSFVLGTKAPSLVAMRHATGQPGKLPSTDLWGSWRLDELFILRKGKRLTKATMKPGTVPYIGSSEFRNGETARIDHAPQFPGHVITVPYNGSVGHAFYQPVPFCAGDDVHVLIPKDRISPAALLGVCTIIRAEKYRFGYGRKWHLGRMVESVIRLPQTLEKKPDWDLLDSYIRGLPFSSTIPGSSPTGFTESDDSLISGELAEASND
jgi:hypothetical protein